MKSLVVLVLVAAGCEAASQSECEARCPVRESPTTSPCAEAVALLPEGTSVVTAAEAQVIDVDQGDNTLVRWIVDCACFSDPLELRVARADADGAFELAPLTAPVLEDEGRNFVVELPDGVVTEGSVWAIQTTDADGEATAPVCADIIFSGA